MCAKEAELGIAAKQCGDYTAHKRFDGTVQTVRDHLFGVADLAESFGHPFMADAHAYRTGLLHDIGKYAPDVQKRMNDPEHVAKVNHTSAGAIEASKLRDLPGMFAIAAHHGGLMDRTELIAGKLQYKPQDYHAYKQEIHITSEHLLPSWTNDMLSCSFYTRMLFSCLVDADYLDTEAFMQDKTRPVYSSNMTALADKLQHYVKGWFPPRTPINEKRCEILSDCKSAATMPKGLYTLTVPTGGGKTVSSLMFALKHAVMHDCDRVIYVIPYTSIIEQNAAVFEKILGEENVLQHHSGAEQQEKGQDEELNLTTFRKRMATENWDAPLIVTTAVQFFESIYASRTSKCRKLHNLANSVIIFDEAQMLPLDYLRPCVYAITELVRHYQSTAVLCTATQPALSELIHEYMPQADIREIVQDPVTLYQWFRRTSYRLDGELSEEDLLARLDEHEQVLCIVNSRKLAQRIFDKMPPQSRFHLSTWMTPRDRRAAITKIRRCLAEGRRCHVISTSLIEAGVDLDFPSVWRQVAGLDSVLQAGGRCNREGKRPTGNSIVHIFRINGQANRMIQKQVDAFRMAIERDGVIDDPATIQYYFEVLLKSKGQAIDKEEILRCCEGFRFQTVADRFHLIDDRNSATIYIPQPDNEELLDELRDSKYSRSTIRKLQKDSICITEQQLNDMIGEGKVETTADGFLILADSEAYDSIRGLRFQTQQAKALFV